MPDRQLPENLQPPQIDTPRIDIQDLEHKPDSRTRVNNRGIRVKPRVDPQVTVDDRMFAREDEKAREAVDQFEEWLKKQPPG